MKVATIGLALTLAFATGALAHGPGHKGHGGHGHGGHGHGHAAFAAGEPGDPKKPSRIVQVAMSETEDGRMLFTPDTLSVRRGEQVKFVLRNVGKVEHEFVVDSSDGIAEHRAEMAKNPGAPHGDANEIYVDPKKSGELVWKFTKAGTFEFACMLPGHYEAGMKGTVTVK